MRETSGVSSARESHGFSGCRKDQERPGKIREDQIEIIIKPEISGFIRSNLKFLVAGHKNPDGDCAGSQLALVHFLKRIGKTALAVSAGPFDRLEIQHLKQQFFSPLDNLPDLAGYVAIILDTSTPDRLGSIRETVTGLNSLVIDHHSSREDFGGLQLIDAGIPATTLIIQRLIEELGYAPDAGEASLLLYGLCTDTGFFRHLESQSAFVFQAVARLTAAGASVKEIFSQMFGGINLAERKLLATILLKTEEHFKKRVLFTYLNLEEKESLLPMTLKTEEVYRLLQLVEDVDLVLFIKQETTNRFSVSFRSNGRITVDNLAAQLGGGGHKLAAGCELTGNYTQIRELLLATVKPFFK